MYELSFNKSETCSNFKWIFFSETANIEKVEEDLYLVESAEKKGLKYEVNSTVGWCSCPSGKTGHFCKHQAVVFEKYGVGFPNKPAITFQERYELGLLALGPQKCPKVDFFKDFDEVKTDKIRIKTKLVI